MVKKIISILFLVVLLKVAYAQDIDSLKILVKVGVGSSKIKPLNLLCEQTWLQGSYDHAKDYVAQLLELEDTELKKSPHNVELLKEKAYTYNNLAIIHRYKGNYPEAIENHLNALKIRESIKDTFGIARSNLGLGSIYDFMGKKEEALKYKFIAKRIFEEVHDTLFIAFTCNHIAGIYFDLGNITEARKFNYLALMTFIKKGHLSGMADAFTLAGQIFESTKVYNDAISNFEGSLSSKTFLGQKDGIAEANLNLGRVYLKINNLKKADQYLSAGLLIAQEIGAKGYLRDLYLVLAKMDSVSNSYASAFKNYKLYIAYRDSLVNQETAERITRLQTEFENEKIMQIKALEEERKETVRKEKEYKQKLILYSISGGLLIMLVFSIVVFRSYRTKQKINKELLVKNEIIAEQKHEVEEKQKEILDSIRYAKRIQTSLLASDRYITKNIDRLKDKVE